jgi:hypothetical protein
MVIFNSLKTKFYLEKYTFWKQCAHRCEHFIFQLSLKHWDRFSSTFGGHCTTIFYHLFLGQLFCLCSILGLYPTNGAPYFWECTSYFTLHFLLCVSMLCVFRGLKLPCLSLWYDFISIFCIGKLWWDLTLKKNNVPYVANIYRNNWKNPLQRKTMLPIFWCLPFFLISNVFKEKIAKSAQILPDFL